MHKALYQNAKMDMKIKKKNATSNSVNYLICVATKKNFDPSLAYFIYL